MENGNNPSSDKNVANQNNPLPPQPVNQESFTGQDMGDTSIGAGSSDQGFDPGEEERDDQFLHDDHFSGKETILDKENTQHGDRPDHGLVEEGPGPDS